MSLIRKFHLYGFWGFLKLVLDIFTTRIRFRGARIVRRPIYVRGKHNIKWGTGFTTGVGTRLDVFCKDLNVRLCFGNNVEINDYVHIAVVEGVYIGNDVLIASHVFITDHNHGSYGKNNIHSNPHEVPRKRILSSMKVTIEDNVWIGEYVVILPGITIGKGSVIGSMSVVNKDIPPFCIAVGSPIKIIKKFDEHTMTWKSVKN